MPTRQTAPLRSRLGLNARSVTLSDFRTRERLQRLIVAPIDRVEAIALVKRHHYSRSYCRNSQLHLGVFLDGRLVGAMQFGPPMVRRVVLSLVPGTPWYDMLELNRMVLAPRIPRNAESRVIGMACRLLRRHAPHIKWVLSFADAGQCGDGTIYRASGFYLTGIRWTEFLRLPSGQMVHGLAATANAPQALGGAASVCEFARRAGAERVRMPSIRYIRILDPALKLATPPLPYSALADRGVRCYKGRKTSGQRSAANKTRVRQNPKANQTSRPQNRRLRQTDARKTRR